MSDELAATPERFRKLTGAPSAILRALLISITVLGSLWALEIHHHFEVTFFKQQYLALFLALGLGSVFLAIGLYVRNPIVPAALLLLWEGANGILPHALQRMSILYYLQSLCPVPPPMDDDAPALIRLLAAPAAPATRLGAILGLMVLTALVLWIASLAVRRMQISYGGENS